MVWEDSVYGCLAARQKTVQWKGMAQQSCSVHATRKQSRGTTLEGRSQIQTPRSHPHDPQTHIPLGGSQSNQVDNKLNYHRYLQTAEEGIKSKWSLGNYLAICFTRPPQQHIYWHLLCCGYYQSHYNTSLTNIHMCQAHPTITWGLFLWFCPLFLISSVLPCIISIKTQICHSFSLLSIVLLNNSLHLPLPSQSAEAQRDTRRNMHKPQVWATHKHMLKTTK